MKRRKYAEKIEVAVPKWRMDIRLDGTVAELLKQTVSATGMTEEKIIADAVKCSDLDIHSSSPHVFVLTLTSVNIIYAG
jgi:hypothetical protein